MTPMVDLGFLLISFFVITTELSQPRAMNLAMPKEDGPPSELCNSCALTLLLDGERNYYYEGAWDQALRGQNIRETSILGLRDVIVSKQQVLDDTTRFPEGRNGLMLLIKPSLNAKYELLVDALDEAVINQVKKYAILPLSPEENSWLRQRK